jgi:hypothetical protein
MRVTINAELRCCDYLKMNNAIGTVYQRLCCIVLNDMIIAW